MTSTRRAHCRIGRAARICCHTFWLGSECIARRFGVARAMSSGSGHRPSSGSSPSTRSSSKAPPRKTLAPLALSCRTVSASTPGAGATPAISSTWVMGQATRSAPERPAASASSASRSTASVIRCSLVNGSTWARTAARVGVGRLQRHPRGPAEGVGELRLFHRAGRDPQWMPGQHAGGVVLDLVRGHDRQAGGHVLVDLAGGHIAAADQDQHHRVPAGVRGGDVGLADRPAERHAVGRGGAQQLGGRVGLAFGAGADVAAHLEPGAGQQRVELPGRAPAVEHRLQAPGPRS